MTLFFPSVFALEKIIMAEEPTPLVQQEQKDPNKINIRLINAEGVYVDFKVKKTTSFGRVFFLYCEKTGIQLPSARFLFDGNRIREDATPGSLDMEDNAQ